MDQRCSRAGIAENSGVRLLDRLVCWWGLALVVFCTTTDSQGLNIVSTEFRVSGSWAEYWTDKESWVSDDTGGSFNAESLNGSHLSGAWTSTHGWAWCDATLSSWSLRMNGEVRSGDDLSESLSVDYVQLRMDGSATTRFYPGSGRIKLHLDALDWGAYTGPDFPESMMQITLVDLTTSETLLETDYWRDHPDWIADSSDRPLYEYDVSASHLYEFKLMGAFWIWAGSIDWGDLSAEAEIVDMPTVVPDPGFNLAMFAVSVSSLVLVRRSQVNSRLGLLQPH